MRFALTKRCEYGIRILIHLAMQGPGARATAGELAEICDIPAGNVPTIVNTLSRAGLLSCTPGRRGGCRLARHPGDVTILEAIQSLEGPLDTNNCLLDSRRCHDVDPHCALHDEWAATKVAALGVLGEITLADAAAREAEIQVDIGSGPISR